LFFLEIQFKSVKVITRRLDVAFTLKLAWKCSILWMVLGTGFGWDRVNFLCSTFYGSGEGVSEGLCGAWLPTWVKPQHLELFKIFFYIFPLISMEISNQIEVCVVTSLELLT